MQQIDSLISSSLSKQHKDCSITASTAEPKSIVCEEQQHTAAQKAAQSFRKGPKSEAYGELLKAEGISISGLLAKLSAGPTTAFFQQA